MIKTVVRPVSRIFALFGLMALAACQHPGTLRTDSASAASQPVAAAQQTAQAATQQAASSAAPVITFHLAQTSPAQGLAQVQVNPSVTLYAVPQPVFTQADLQQVITTQNGAGQSILRFDFNEAGAAKLEKLASEAAGNYMMVSVRGQLIAVSKIAPSYPDGKFPVPAASANDARDILQKLR